MSYVARTSYHALKHSRRSALISVAVTPRNFGLVERTTRITMLLWLPEMPKNDAYRRRLRDSSRSMAL
jgi:hypothetical protein